MKGITLWQPWATLMALDSKRLETRSWPTAQRGPTLIHAAKGIPADYRDGVAALIHKPEFRAFLPPKYPTFFSFPVGGIVAIGRLVDCYPTSREHRAKIVAGDRAHEIAFGDHSDGRYVHEYENIIELPATVQCRGGQKYWDVPDDVRAIVLDLLQARQYRLPQDYIDYLS